MVAYNIHPRLKYTKITKIGKGQSELQLDIDWQVPHGPWCTNEIV